MGSLTFNYTKVAIFHTLTFSDTFIVLKVPFICSLSRTSFCATVNHRASQTQVAILPLQPW